MGPNAGHHVALFEQLEQARDVGRVVLQVGIEGHHHVAAGGAEAGREGGGLALVARETQDPDGITLLLETAQHIIAAIVAAVVDKKHFEGLVAQRFFDFRQ